MKRIAILIFLLSLLNCRLSAQKISDEEKEILVLQDTRSLGENNKLLGYLNSDSKNLVVRTLYALANIADSNTIDDIGKVLLSNGDAQIREYAAFALGQIPNRKSADYLSKALDTEQNPDVLCRVLNSIGRTGDEADLNKVSDYKTVNEACIAMSIARFGMRKIKNEKGFGKLDSLLLHNYGQKSGMQTLRNVAYAYNRIGDEKYLNRYLNNLEMLCESKIPEVRMWVSSTLGKAKDSMCTMYCVTALSEMVLTPGTIRQLIWEFPTNIVPIDVVPGPERDWRVKINLLNSLANFDYNIDSNTLNIIREWHLYANDPMDNLIRSADDNNENVSLMVIQTIGKIHWNMSLIEDERKRAVWKLKDVLESSSGIYTFRQKSEAAIALASIFKDKANNELVKVYKSTNDWDVKAGIIRAFGKFEDGKVYRTVRELISADVQEFSKKNPGSTNALASSKEMLKLYRAFIEMLTSLDKKVNDEDKNNIRLIYSEFLSSKDPILTDLTLTALMDSMYIKYRPETQKIIMFDYEELKLPNDADVMQLYVQAMGELKMTEAVDLLEKNLKSESYDIAKASADALQKITGKDYQTEITAQKYRTDFDWEYIEKLNDKRFVVMKTNKGDIRLELFPETAPFTVQSFLKLAEKHYYDSTVFHRVVPNFVIQGGDPTGTGYSGPGYSIRSEFSPLSYETGYLGMASSGKDTEGSQFFITHSPQPHLDGRYTIFGKVTDGMNVVDKIQVGDVLEQLIIAK